MADFTSPLDVLDGYFSGTPDLEAVRALTLAQIDDLGELVEQSAEVLSREGAAADGARDLIYPGGWLARGWGEELFRVELNCALLYEPRVLLHDPLAEYFFSAFSTLPRMRSIKGAAGSSIYAGPDMWANHGRRVHRGDDLERIRGDLTRIVGFLLDVEPLLRSGVIVMRSQWPTIRRRQQQLMASAKADMSTPALIQAAESATSSGGLLPRWDNLRGGQVTPPGGYLDPAEPALWQPEFFYLAKTLAVADAAGAMYAPATADEARLLIAKTVATATGLHAKPGQPVLREVLSFLVPDLVLAPAAAVKIRASEEAFDSWRRMLRDIQREAAGLTDPNDLRQLVQDRVQPQVDAVQRAVGMSSALRAHGEKAVTAAVLSTAASSLTGVPFSTSAAAAGVTGVAGWLWDAYRARRADGSASVVAALLRAHR